MNCCICNKQIDIFHPTPEMEKLGITTDKEGYTCQCSLYYFSELTFIRDNKIDLKKSLDESEYNLFNRKLYEKKTWINARMPKSQNGEDHIDHGRIMFENENSKNEVGSEFTEEAKSIHKVIWYLLFKAQGRG